MKRILTVALMLMSVSAFAKAPAKTDQKNKNNFIVQKKQNLV